MKERETHTSLPDEGGVDSRGVDFAFAVRRARAWVELEREVGGTGATGTFRAATMVELGVIRVRGVAALTCVS